MEAIAPPPLSSPSPLPPLPKLSASQKSYRDNPDGFLTRLKARAENLFEEGYTVYPAAVRHEFVVAHSEAKRDSTEPVAGYLVSPLLGTCSCPFHQRQRQGEFLGENDRRIVPCKHLLGLAPLVRATCRWHAQSDQIHLCCVLWQHWMMTQSEKRRERCEREKRLAAHSSR